MLCNAEQAFPGPVAAEVERWFKHWSLIALMPTLHFRFSGRMFRSIGRCYPTRRTIALAVGVRELPEPQILDILCHECAHLAAYELYGLAIRPHGAEWRKLVASVGYLPRVRFEDDSAIQLIRSRARLPTRYLHRCLTCRRQRTARRRMSHWRCGACYEIGLDGRLEILKLTN